MLASIFGKVTASLGKTYVFSGLIPAGLLILAVASFLLSPGSFWSAGQDLLTETSSWKGWAWLGAIWLASGFMFYVARAAVFRLFQIIPTGPFGRRLLFRRIAKRERLRRRRAELEWQGSALNWLQNLDLQRSEIGDISPWLVRSRPAADEALAASRAGRETLTKVDRTVGDVLNLTVSQSDRIIAGIFALYRLAQHPRSPAIEAQIASEIEQWRFATVSREARTIVEFVFQDNKRAITKAFYDCQKFGEGPNVFPTALGNLLSALDDYGEKRYGIDTATIWDRLWWVLPKEIKIEVSDARLAVETLVNVVVAFLLAIVCIVLLQGSVCGFAPNYAGACDATRATVFVGAGALLALIAYRGARFAMEVLATKMTSLIDMYRLAALAQLGFSPKTVGEERNLHAALKRLFIQAAALKKKLKINQKGESSEGKKGAKEDEEKKEGEKDSKKGGGEQDETQDEDGDGAEGDGDGDENDEKDKDT